MANEFVRLMDAISILLAESKQDFLNIQKDWGTYFNIPRLQTADMPSTFFKMLIEHKKVSSSYLINLYHIFNSQKITEKVRVKALKFIQNYEARYISYQCNVIFLEMLNRLLTNNFLNGSLLEAIKNQTPNSRELDPKKNLDILIQCGYITCFDITLLYSIFKQNPAIMDYIINPYWKNILNMTNTQTNPNNDSYIHTFQSNNVIDKERSRTMPLTDRHNHNNYDLSSPGLTPDNKHPSLHNTKGYYTSSGPPYTHSNSNQYATIGMYGNNPSTIALPNTYPQITYPETNPAIFSPQANTTCQQFTTEELPSLLEDEYRIPAFDFEKQVYPGECIIINIEHFTNEPDKRRLGSQADVRKIAQTFLELNFRVIKYVDLTSQEIINVLKLKSMDQNLAKVGMLICFLMSHGQEGQIHGSDGSSVVIDDIICNFKNNTCSQLRGKPKMFVIQACRGNRLDHGLFTDSIDDVKQPGAVFAQDADLIICSATTPGRVAVRTEEGSWYIDTLCDSIIKYHLTTSITEIHTRVNREVSKKGETHPDSTLQVSTTSVSLTRNLCLRANCSADEFLRCRNYK